MLKHSLKPLLLAVATWTAAATAGAAQTYPDRAVRIVVPYPPGGSADLIGRMVADKLAKSLGQPVVVENKGGASGAIGSETVARAEPDGYTLLIGISDTHALAPAVSSNVPYHPVKDFAPISLLAVQPFVLAVGPKLKATTLADFTKAAKERPGKVTYASNGAGGLQHLAMELFNGAAGTKTLHVPYKGAGPALSDVMGGHVDAIFISLQAGAGNLKSGKLHPIAITSGERLAVAPEIPTFAESGFPAFKAQQWYGLFAPSRTPPEIVARLSKDAAEAMRAPDVAEKLRSAGTEPIGSTSAEFETFLAGEIATWAQVAKANNIKLD